jgi:uncharacterized protein YecE (DUF72 family)
MLRFYCERFRSVEINSTFKRLPTSSVLDSWAGAVARDFKFALKASERITHFRRLRNAGTLVADLFRVAAALKSRLGPVLFQLPPNFKKDVTRLREFLELLPSRRRAALEFRHDSWFAEDVFTLLRKHRVALCIADAEDELKVPFVATAAWGYLRLRRPNYSTSALKAWVKRVQAQVWRDAFVFFKHEDEGTGPRLAKRFLELAG